MAKLQCDIVTPEKALFSGEAYLVEAPSTEGSFGALPGHEALSCLLSSGIAKVYLDEAHKDVKEFVVFAGFAQVYDDKVTVLARKGIAVDDIDADAVSAELEALKQRMATLTEEDKAAADKFTDAMFGADLSDDLTAEELANKAVAATVVAETKWCEMLLAARKN